MNLPQADEPAYDGNLIVKSTTYGKSKKGKVSGLDKVKRAVASLEAEADKRLTIDYLDPSSDISVENQLIINKALCAELRKQAMILNTFIRNN